MAKQAARCGDERLALICKKIAGDESRHEQFYTRMMGEVIDRIPSGGLVVMRQMLRRIIAMPGRQMFDGKDADLFDHFAAVAQRMGVYTARLRRNREAPGRHLADRRPRRFRKGRLGRISMCSTPSSWTASLIKSRKPP